MTDRIVTREQGRSTIQEPETPPANHDWTNEQLAELVVPLHPAVHAVTIFAATGREIAKRLEAAAMAEHWRQVSVDSLVVVTGLRADLAAARAEIERQREYIAGRVYDCCEPTLYARHLGSGTNPSSQAGAAIPDRLAALRVQCSFLDTP